MSYAAKSDFPFSFQLKSTIAGREYYASVFLKVEFSDHPGIAIDAHNPLEKWHNDSAEFGLNYAWAQYQQAHPEEKRGINVEIATQGLALPETTPAMMAYAGAMAMYKALNFKPEKPVALQDHQVIFPV